jgi:hypothetical protein
VDKHPRFLAPLTSHGWSDIVGFGDAGVYVALSNGDGTFSYDPQPVIDALGYVAGGWRVDRHPRLLAPLTSNGWSDIVGFGEAGVVVALGDGQGGFSYNPQPVITDFGYAAGGWRVDKHPRFLAAVTSNGWSDVVGFGDAGVLMAPSNGDGTFTQPASRTSGTAMTARSNSKDRSCPIPTSASCRPPAGTAQPCSTWAATQPASSGSGPTA